MTTVKKVLDIAKNEIGYTETYNNNNKFGRDLGENNVSWCALFLLHCLIKSGFEGYKKHVFDYDYCPKWLNDFKIQGISPKVPVIGDIVFYAFDSNLNKLKIPQHVGIIESILPNGDIVSIEGNTGDPSKSQSDGDGVYRKIRLKKFAIGFGRPPYTKL